MTRLISGKELAQTRRQQLAQAIESRFESSGKRPGLAVVQVGDHPASTVYVTNKEKACQSVGIRSCLYRLPQETSQQELLALIDTLNQEASIHGILCQLPLPAQIDPFTVICAIDPAKDVDGFHPINAGLLALDRQAFVPCTPLAVVALLKSAQVQLVGSHCVIVGRSHIVGKPLAQLMLQEQATVTVAHSRTRDLAALCRQAQVLVAAAGRPGLITADHVQPGAAVIDVGINRTPEGKLVGDVAFDAVFDKAGVITPVPGGVGPMTIALLLQNTFDAFLRQAADWEQRGIDGSPR